MNRRLHLFLSVFLSCIGLGLAIVATTAVSEDKMSAQTVVWGIGAFLLGVVQLPFILKKG